MRGHGPYFLYDAASQALPPFFWEDGFVELSVAVRGIGRPFPEPGAMLCAGACGGGPRLCCLPTRGLESFPRSTKRSISFSRLEKPSVKVELRDRNSTYAAISGSVPPLDLSLAPSFGASLELALTHQDQYWN